MKKLFCIFLALTFVFAFAGCSKETEEEITEPVVNQEAIVSQVVAETTTQVPETTTEATTVPETTTVPDGSSIQNIIDTLESKQFYMAGTINLTGGESMDAKTTCEGDNSRIDITSARMNMSMIYLDGTAYIANASTNTYAVFDETAIDSMEQMFSNMSSYGINFSSTDISEMKNMMKDFDTSMDYSQYIEDGEYSEFNITMNEQEYLVSEYATEYGKIRIYTQQGELKVIDVFDTNGLRQMNFVVSAFIPQVLTPITLNGLTLTSSVMNLFTGI